MSNQPARPWRVIAGEMLVASRGDRILELAEELERALREQSPVPPRKSVKPLGSQIVDTGPGDPQKKTPQPE